MQKAVVSWEGNPLVIRHMLQKYADTSYSSWDFSGKYGNVAVLFFLECWLAGAVSMELVHLQLTEHWCLWTPPCGASCRNRMPDVIEFTLGSHCRARFHQFQFSCARRQSGHFSSFLLKQCLLWVIDNRDGLPQLSHFCMKTSKHWIICMKWVEIMFLVMACDKVLQSQLFDPAETRNLVLLPLLG